MDGLLVEYHMALVLPGDKDVGTEIKRLQVQILAQTASLFPTLWCQGDGTSVLSFR